MAALPAPVLVATPARRPRAKIPEDLVYRSKNQLALELVDQVLEWKVPHPPVVADSACGNDFDFRAGLRERGLQYAGGSRTGQQGLTSNPSQTPVAASKPRGRPRQYPALKDLPEAKTLAEGRQGFAEAGLAQY